MSICPRCGTVFSCGVVDDITDQPCWCMQRSGVEDPSTFDAKDLVGASCYCPVCLDGLKKLKNQIQQQMQQQ